VVNVLSNLTWWTTDWNTPYSPAKSAAWSYSKSLRVNLRDEGCTGPFVAYRIHRYRDGSQFDTSETHPRVIASTTIDAPESGQRSLRPMSGPES